MQVSLSSQMRHLESNTNSACSSLNVILSLDTDINHLILDHCILRSSMSNGSSH